MRACPRRPGIDRRLPRPAGRGALAAVEHHRQPTEPLPDLLAGDVNNHVVLAALAAVL